MVRRLALLLGGNGFAGTHLQNLLKDQYDIVAAGREVDVRDERRIDALIQARRPDVVVNLAALTTVRETAADPRNTYRTGFLGSLGLLEALQRCGFEGTYLNISSSEVYGYPVPEELPITEASPLRPMSPYAVDKIATEVLCGQWSRTCGFSILTARPFTHIGPGQSDRFAISNFGRQIAEIAVGHREPMLRVGNLHATRDITDVRDTVRAYARLIEFGESGGIYQICSGVEVSIRSLLDEMIEFAGLKVAIEVDSAVARSSEQSRVRGSFDKLRTLTGWKPEIPLQRTLADVYQYWLQRSRR